MKRSFFLVLALLMPASVFAQNIVADRLDVAGMYQAMADMVNEKYSDTGSVQVLRLREGESSLVSLNLAAAGPYVALAVCDDDYEGLAVATVGVKNQEIDDEQGLDFLSTLDVREEQSIEMLVSMASCNNKDGCEVKIGLLKGR